MLWQTCFEHSLHQHELNSLSLSVYAIFHGDLHTEWLLLEALPLREIFSSFLWCLVVDSLL